MCESAWLKQNGIKLHCSGRPYQVSDTAQPEVNEHLQSRLELLSVPGPELLNSHGQRAMIIDSRDTRSCGDETRTSNVPTVHQEHQLSLEHYMYCCVTEERR